MDRLRLEFISPKKLTSHRRFELNNREACQIVEDIQQEFADYIVEDINDFTAVDCIKITHFCPEQPNEEIMFCFDFDIKNELLLFIRNHEMKEQVKPG